MEFIEGRMEDHMEGHLTAESPPPKNKGKKKNCFRKFSSKKDTITKPIKAQKRQKIRVINLITISHSTASSHHKTITTKRNTNILISPPDHHHQKKNKYTRLTQLPNKQTTPSLHSSQVPLASHT
ncbi:hypothetical protein E2C01_057787 [Portunus trituberculatus]|uniref:Uncharacterized protein n=1 Tax=Portunus trituberculatus TaxID=210409 RepID=A0A5B7H226_PORTR|nr:hypothetical protein [Portunus trituberculatus]